MSTLSAVMVLSVMVGAGAVVSIVTSPELVSVLLLPAASVTLALTLLGPSGKAVGTANDQLVPVKVSSGSVPST